MKFADTVLSWAAFCCICVAVLMGPWLFGAYEMWWFWTFTLFLTAATLFSAVRMLMRGVAGEKGARSMAAPRAGGRAGAVIAASYVPFLIYALTACFRDTVYLDAERGWLLLLLPFLVALHVLYGAHSRQRFALFVLVVADLVLLGLYGVINHIVTRSHLVLWREGYEQYTDAVRATGSYFCPDHFSGIMEIGLGLGLGLLLTRGLRSGWKVLGGALGIIGLAGVVLSKSRGGGLTVIVMLLAVLVWGLSQWRAVVRWCLRGGILAAGLVGLVLFTQLARPYVARFMQYFDMDELRGRPALEMVARLARGYTYSDRGLMVRGSLRAWQTAPVFGIGTGMHKHYWPHYGPTPDGDRELGIWPSVPNLTYQATRSHCDWVQLLEECGVVGFALFLVPFLAFTFPLLHAIRTRGLRTRRSGHEAEPMAHAIVLGGLLSFVAMSFHSLGDFNLRMPATGWLFGAIIALTVAAFPRREEPTPNPSREGNA